MTLLQEIHQMMFVLVGVSGLFLASFLLCYFLFSIVIYIEDNLPDTATAPTVLRAS